MVGVSGASFEEFESCKIRFEAEHGDGVVDLESCKIRFDLAAERRELKQEGVEGDNGNDDIWNKIPSYRDIMEVRQLSKKISCESRAILLFHCHLVSSMRSKDESSTE